MTRRGSLIYYLSAWILGCFFISLLIWIKDMYAAKLDHPLAGFAVGLLSFSFFGLVSGAPTALIISFLLRRLMSALRCKTPAHWALAGGILAPIVIAIFGTWGRHISMEPPGGARLLGLLTFGPKTVLEAGWWLAIPAGAGTAFLLCRIERAFAAPTQTAVNA